MNPPAFDQYVVMCPQCGATNTITTVDIPAGMKIDCSACQAPIGSWGEIRSKITAPHRAATV